MDVTCAQGWVLGEQLGQGGFGRVYRARGEDGTQAAVKLVPREPGASRELLFVDLVGVRNVMPVLESGETDTYWVLVMPLAEESLKDRIDTDAPMALKEVVVIMRDVTTALVDLTAKSVVHRDLKPGNVLRYDGRWMLADFGISRFAEASTAIDTHKYSASPPYNAPERWRGERATAAADVYSLGVMAYELLSGRRPFAGPTTEEYRNQHLHEAPPQLTGMPPRLAALIDECLFKSADSRPTPSNLLRRLEKAAESASAPGAGRLSEVYHVHTRQAAEESRKASQAATDAERRQQLLQAARRSFATLQEELREVLLESAPGLLIMSEPDGGWSVSLGQARLVINAVKESNTDWGGWQRPVFDVIAHSDITLHASQNPSVYAGREHSFWYCDVQEAAAYGWFEAAFMDHPFERRQSSPREPFALPPGKASGQALGNVTASYQMAWPFSRLDSGDIDEFTDRWLAWFATAAEGALRHPVEIPDRRPEGSWRRA